MVKILFFYVFCYLFSFKQNFRKEKKSFVGTGGVSPASKNPFVGATHTNTPEN